MSNPAGVDFRNNLGTGVVTADSITLGTTPVTATGAELNEYTITAFQADAGTAGSVYVVAPHAGNIVGLSVVPFVANATTKTVYLAKLATITVTAPAWETTITQAAGVATTVVPTAANAVTPGQVIEIASDGGSSSVMPVMYSIKISR